MSGKDNLMNGVAAAAPTPNAQPFAPPPALLKLAEDVVAAVKCGRIMSLACITVSPLGEIGWPGCVVQLPEIMIGAEMMRDDMKAGMRQGGRSKIMRVGGG